MKARTIILLSLAYLLATVTACGGGGGGGSDSTPSRNACSILGLNARVINGTACSGSSPVAELFLEGSDGSLSRCSGTFISTSDILTAGHCFIGGNIISVVAITPTGNVRTRDFAIHPNFIVDRTKGLVFNDVAIIKLPQPVSINPVPILVSRGVSTGDIISIFGYGFDEHQHSDRLISGQMKVSSVTDTHIGAEFNSDEGSNTCQGDSGGPALINFEDSSGNSVSAIAGITSTGRLDNCGPGDTSFFALLDTDLIRNFITSQVPSASLE